MVVVFSFYMELEYEELVEVRMKIIWEVRDEVICFNWKNK